MVRMEKEIYSLKGGGDLTSNDGPRSGDLVNEFVQDPMPWGGNPMIG